MHSCNKEGGSGPLRAPAAGAPASLGKGKPVMHPEYGYAYSMVHGVVFPPFASEEAIDEMRTVDWSQENDIMIATYPKCGTTWMQQIVLLLLAKGDASKVHDPMVQSPWVDREFSIAHTSGDAAKKAAAWDMLNAEPDPAFGRRVFKTHAPWQLHPCGGDFSKGKFICITRNPKDAALSMHKHYLGLPPFRCGASLPTLPFLHRRDRRCLRPRRGRRVSPRQRKCPPSHRGLQLWYRSHDRVPAPCQMLASQHAWGFVLLRWWFARGCSFPRRGCLPHGRATAATDHDSFP